MPSATSKPDRYRERSPSRSERSSPSSAVIRRWSWPDQEREFVTARKGSHTVEIVPLGEAYSNPLGTGASRDSARVSRKEQRRQASQKIVLPSIPTSIRCRR